MEGQNNTCTICADTYTDFKRKKVKCGMCEFECCKECVQTYLLGQSADPHCMSCKKKWDREFLYENLGNGFVNGTYKKHKKDLLFEIEKSKIPGTMPRVEDFVQIDKNMEKIKYIDKETEEIRKYLSKLNNTKYNLQLEIQSLRRGNTKKKARDFKHHCPVEDCKGFVSKQWKCAVCSTWACSKCHQVIGSNQNDPHVCKQSDIDSVEAIKKSTKPCPTCSVPIQKSVGCNQMWCTQCHVAFDWKTGEIQNGVIHNPHFFEAQRMGMVRAPGDNVCGGIPNWREWDKAIRIIYRNLAVFGDKSSESAKRTAFIQMAPITYRYAGENIDIIANLRGDLTRNTGPAMEEIRIQFIMGNIDEKKYKTRIGTMDTAREKKQAMLDVLEIYNTVMIENMQYIVAELESYHWVSNNSAGLPLESTHIKSIEKIYKRFQSNMANIKEYVNDRTRKISYHYNQSYMRINDNGRIVREKKASKPNGSKTTPKETASA